MSESKEDRIRRLTRVRVSRYRNTENGKQKRSEYNRTWLNKGGRQKKSDSTFKRKLSVLWYYSRGKMICECCSNDTIEFLTIDHIHGNGRQHKKDVNHIYDWIITHGFPEIFRVLCIQCNWSLGHYGYCPHNDKTKHESFVNRVNKLLPNNNIFK